MKPAEVIKLQLKKLNSSRDSMLDGLGKKKVHDFRLRVKRLKAFTDLLNYAGHHHLKIRRQLKDLYDCTGTIRNLQLQQKRILQFSENTGARPGTYLRLLAQEEEQCRQKAFQLGDAGKMKNFASRIPDRIKNKTVKNFLRDKAAKLWVLLLACNIPDEDLHSLRKILKEIFYNWRYVSVYATNFLPLCWRHKSELQSFTDVLGEFHDLCIALQLLDASFPEPFTSKEEVRLLNSIKEQLEIEKSSLKGKLNQAIETIRDAIREPAIPQSISGGSS